MTLSSSSARLSVPLALLAASLAACDCGEKVQGARSVVSADPASLDFGQQEVGTSATKEVTLKNDGSAPLNIESFTITDDARGAFALDPALAAVTVAVGETVVVKVTYNAPATEGPDGGALLVTSDADNTRELRVSLAGRAVLSCGPGTTSCGGACSNLQTDKAHCGKCETSCKLAGDACVNGACVCTPKTCVELGKTCGTPDDGCGKALSCGSCASNEVCGAANTCACDTSKATAENCNNVLDDDCDGKVDCDDSDCAANPMCTNPTCPGTDRRVSQFASSDDGGPVLLWNGAGYGLFWQRSSGSGGSDYPFVKINATATTFSVPGPTIPANPPTAAHKPHAAWNGTAYGLAWSDIRNGAAQMSNDVYARIWNPSGNWDSAELGVANTNKLEFPAIIAWNDKDKQFGVFYGVNDNLAYTGDLYFQAMDATGAAVGTPQKVLGVTGSASSPVMLEPQTATFGTSEYVVAYHQNVNNKVTSLLVRVSAAGAKVGTPLDLGDGSPQAIYPDVLFNGTEYAVAWADTRDGGDDEIYFARVKLDGTYAGTPQRITNATGRSTDPHLTWTGSKYAVAWTDYRAGATAQRVYFAEISALGAKVGADKPLVCGASKSGSPSLVWNGTDYAVAWSDDRANAGAEWEIYFKTFTP